MDRTWCWWSVWQTDEAHRQAARVKRFLLMVPFTYGGEGEDAKPLSHVPRDVVYTNFEDEAFVTVREAGMPRERAIDALTCYPFPPSGIWCCCGLSRMRNLSSPIRPKLSPLALPQPALRDMMMTK